MKLLFLVADGMGGWPLEALGGKTTLEAAPTPMMDALAKRGVVGTLKTVPDGMQPGSDVANMALIGCDPAVYHTGRGPIEAASQGLKVADDDIIYRLNTVTVSEWAEGGLMKDYSAGHISSEEGRAIVEELQEQFGSDAFTFYPGIQYRHLLVQHGVAGTHEAGVDIRPPHDITDQPITADLMELTNNPALARLVEQCVEYLGQKHPESKANAVWPWGQGKGMDLPDFEETRGMKGGIISAVDVIMGLGRALNMDVIEVPGATGTLDTNYEGKAQAAIDYLQENDFVFVHVEAPDEAGHGGNADEKIEAIRRFDERILKPLYDAFGDDVAYVVCCDHLTPIEIRTHHADPVPFFLFAPKAGLEGSGVEAFNEKTAKDGIALDTGYKFLGWLFEQINK